MDKVKISEKGHRWYRTGHPWIYLDDIVEAGNERSGEIVSVVTKNNIFLGKAFLNTKSKIALRFVTRNDEPIGREFWGKRLEMAIQYRSGVVKDTNACRLIFSESDGFPGLIVDRYGECLSLQVFSLGMENFKPLIVDLLVNQLQPRSVIERNDSAKRRLEGLPELKTVLYGGPPELIECVEGSIRYWANPWEGQKTGGYLDQRENRLYSVKYVGDRVLDGCCNMGGFGLHLAKAGAREVQAVDLNKTAIDLLKQNAALNSIANIHPIEANIFDYLKEANLRNDRWDLIVLDPPAFAKNRKEVPDALRGYKEINLKAIKLLRPGGYLITCSCSYHISEEIFLNMIQNAASDANRQAFLIEKRTQSLDHPILLGMPETHYLKVAICKVM